MKRRRKLETISVVNHQRTHSIRVTRLYRGRGAELGLQVRASTLSLGTIDGPHLWLRRDQARRLRDAITKWLEV